MWCECAADAIVVPFARALDEQAASVILDKPEWFRPAVAKRVNARHPGTPPRRSSRLRARQDHVWHTIPGEVVQINAAPRLLRVDNLDANFCNGCAVGCGNAP